METGKHNGRCLINLYGYEGHEGFANMKGRSFCCCFFFPGHLLLHQSLVDLVWNYLTSLSIKQMIPTRSQSSWYELTMATQDLSWEYIYRSFMSFSAYYTLILVNQIVISHLSEKGVSQHLQPLQHRKTKQTSIWFSFAGVAIHEPS